MTNEDIYGTDYNSQGSVTSTGDISLVTGYDNAYQSIKNQLLTSLGTYPSIDTEYGSRIHEIIGEDLTEPTLNTLSVHITNALLYNPRVKEVNEINTYVSIDKQLKTNISCTLVDGSNELIQLNLTEEI